MMLKVLCVCKSGKSRSQVAASVLCAAGYDAIYCDISDGHALSLGAVWADAIVYAASSPKTFDAIVTALGPSMEEKRTRLLSFHIDKCKGDFSSSRNYRADM